MITMPTRGAARLRADGEHGFALLFVLFVTTVVMIGTATTLSVVTGGIAPSRENQDTAAALSAAQAGVQRMLATLDADCPSGSIAQCRQIASAAGTPLTGVIGTQKYAVSVVNPGNGSLGAGYLSAANRGTLIVKATGVSPVSANGTPANAAVTRTVTAAVSAAPNPLSLAYFSDYETVGSSFLNSYFGPRTITLTDTPADPVLSAIGVGGTAATVTWNGAALHSPSGLGDNICDKLWYDDPSNVDDGDSGPAGRSNLKSARSALPNGTDYAEAGTLAPLGGSGTAVTRYAPCETTFTTGENFNGPVYSRDAFYLSNATSAGDGPLFAVPQGEAQPALWTGWQSTSIPAASVAKPYRSFPIVGGAPKTGSGTVSSSPYAGLSLPSSTGVSAGTCTFTGPTTISLAGSNALVTSPLTSSAGSTCPAPSSTGVFTVPVTTTTIYVQNATSGSGLSLATLANLINLPGADITYYSRTLGDAYVSGTLSSGKLSIVTDDDIIATGNVIARTATPATTNAGNEPSWSPGSAAIDLVATNDVRVYHPVSCLYGPATYGASAAAAPSAAAPNGWCPNDVTGLYSSAQANEVIDSSGTLRTVHPALQYSNVSAASEPTEIDAAIFALNGSFYADNFDRGTGLGTLTVRGGVYENHHGVLGEEWSYPNVPGSSNPRSYSGFKLQINYYDYSNAGLGYVPELTGGNDLEPWQIVSVASGGPTS